MFCFLGVEKFRMSMLKTFVSKSKVSNFLNSYLCEIISNLFDRKGILIGRHSKRRPDKIRIVVQKIQLNLIGFS